MVSEKLTSKRLTLVPLTRDETLAMIESLPAEYRAEVSDEWLDQQAAIIDEAERIGIAMNKTYATVALSDATIASNAQVEVLLERSRNWNAVGVYLICEHPRGDYLVQDPNWLANQIDLVAGWKLAGRSVVLGYSSHLNLLAGAAGVDVIASGTWMNVRSFPPAKFSEQAGRVAQRLKEEQPLARQRNCRRLRLLRIASGSEAHPAERPTLSSLLGHTRQDEQGTLPARAVEREDIPHHRSVRAPRIDE